MVRLKEFAGVLRCAFARKFQFQYGAIKSNNREQQRNASESYFNSSMVRLKETSSIALSILDSDFNSSMVRLKVVKPSSICSMVSIFQFQYGAIKRTNIIKR